MDKKYVIACVVGLVAIYVWRKRRTRLALEANFETAKRKKAERDAKIQQFSDTYFSDQGRIKKNEEILAISFNELRQKLQDRQLKAEDVFLAYAFAAARENARTSCLADTDFDAGLKRARWLDQFYEENKKPLGPLHGIPVSIKDNIHVIGLDSTMGLGSRCFHPSKESAAIVNSILEAGGVVLCKTNVPQTLLIPESVNNVWGATSNPHSAKHTCGGSSGGEGSLIGGGGSLLGLGTDVGGSVRIPAAFCGVVGFKPTSARLSKQGILQAIKGQLAVSGSTGIMSRDVPAATSLFSILCSEIGWSKDPFVVPLPINDAELKSNRKLRIGYFDYDGYFEPHASVKRAVAMAIDILKSEGHELVPFQFPKGEYSPVLYFKLMSADGCKQLSDMLENECLHVRLQKIKRVLQLPYIIKSTIFFLMSKLLQGERFIKLVKQMAGMKSVDELWKTHHELKLYQQECLNAYTSAKLDCVLGPCGSSGPFLHGIGGDLNASFNYTFIYNMLDYPAGVIPITKVTQEDLKMIRTGEDFLDRKMRVVDENSFELPISVQVAALPYKDEIVLRVLQLLADKSKK